MPQDKAWVGYILLYSGSVPCPVTDFGPHIPNSAIIHETSEYGEYLVWLDLSSQHDFISRANRLLKRRLENGRL